MAPDNQTTETDFKLPPQIATKTELARLVQERDLVSEALLQSGLRNGRPPTKAPQTTQLLTAVLELNQIDLLKPSDLQSLGQTLRDILNTAPVLHFSFSADPNPLFIEKLVTWLRREIHPQILLSIGLQPTMGAGCVVRGNSKYFDFSLKRDFIAKREMLVTKLTGTAQA